MEISPDQEPVALPLRYHVASTEIPSKSIQPRFEFHALPERFQRQVPEPLSHSTVFCTQEFVGCMYIQP